MSEDLKTSPSGSDAPTITPMLLGDELREEAAALGLDLSVAAVDVPAPSGPVRMNLFGTSRRDDGVHPILRDLSDGDDLPVPDGDFTRINDAPQLPSGAPRPRRLKKNPGDAPPTSQVQDAADTLTIEPLQAQLSAQHMQSLSGRSPEELVAILREKVGRTQGVQVPGNYLAALGSDFSAALRDLPGLSDEDRELAQALMNYHILTIVATNPALGASLQEIAQLRMVSGLRAGSGFTDDWDALVSTLQGGRREVAASVLDLASNIVRLHDSRAKEAIQRFEGRDAVVGSPVAPGVASIMGATIGSLASAGSRFADGFRRARNEAPASGELDHGVLKNSWVAEPSPIEPPGDSEINLDSWRADRAQALAEDVDRLSAELISRAGDFEWERGRGQEVAGDLKVAIEGLQEIAEGGGLDEARKQQLHDTLAESGRRIEDAEPKMITIHLRDMVKDMAGALSDLAKKMIAGLKNVAKSITGQQDIAQASTPHPSEPSGLPLAEEEPSVHDSFKSNRLKAR